MRIGEWVESTLYDGQQCYFKRHIASFYFINNMMKIRSSTLNNTINVFRMFYKPC